MVAIVPNKGLGSIAAVNAASILEQSNMGIEPIYKILQGLIVPWYLGTIRPFSVRVFNAFAR